MKTIFEKLSAPFQKIGANGQKISTHKWKVQTTKGGVAMCVAYIDARQVAERLNTVLGIDGWSDSLIETNGEGIICEISANIDGKTVVHSNVGTPSDYQKIKGQASDAFKRAATKFGVGAYLYEMEAVRLKLATVNGKKYPSTSDGNALINGNDLTSYINTFHPLRLKLTEIWDAIPKNKQKNYSEIFTKIWEDLK